ncbi:MAG TPA: RNA polymerase sigma factor [Terriglobales bacterium]|nr:RNA polymerase sigma factor [Terriglobales bacterium]
MLVPRLSAEISPDSDDDALMRRVQAGHLQALSPLFERHQRPLLNYFLRLGASRPASEDLVQDVFVRILKYRATYRPGSRFATWMYYIARNVRLDHLHKRRGEVEWDDELHAPSFEPGDAAQAAQEHHLLARALARLSPEKRELLVLSRFQELKHDEIGAILGVETGTVKVRVHRALRELREHFQFLASQADRGAL